MFHTENKTTPTNHPRKYLHAISKKKWNILTHGYVGFHEISIASVQIFFILFKKSIIFIVWKFRLLRSANEK